MHRQLTPSEYFTTALAMNKAGQHPERLFSAVFHAICLSRLNGLSAGALRVLTFILSETLAKGRTGCELSLEEIACGVLNNEGEHVGKGTGLARPTIRVALTELVDKNHINCYSRQSNGRQDNRPRLYEIDFTQYLSPVEIADVMGGAKAVKSIASRAYANGCGKIPTRVEGNLPQQSYIGIDTYGISGTRVSATSSTKSGSSGLGPGDKAKEKDVAYIGKKTPKPVRACATWHPSAVDAIVAVQKEHRTRAAARVESATGKPAYEVTRDELQAMLDAAGTALGLGYRVMATKIPFGALRKKLKDNPPADLKDYVRWVLTYWGTISLQQRTALRKQAGRATAYKPLPETPDFSNFAYRYPYFFQCYQNHLAGKEMVEGNTADPRDAEIARLRRQVEEGRRHTQILRARPAARPVLSTPAQSDTASPLADLSDIPTWEEAQRRRVQ